MINFEPMEGFLAVAQLDDVTAVNGVLLPSRMEGKHEYVAHEGEVLAVGPGRMLTTGENVAPPVSVGDYVYWNPQAGVKVEVEGHKLLLLGVDDLFGIRPQEQEHAFAAPEVSAGG